jgi:hypothetical protein
MKTQNITHENNCCLNNKKTVNQPRKVITNQIGESKKINIAFNYLIRYGGLFCFDEIDTQELNRIINELLYLSY